MLLKPKWMNQLRDSDNNKILIQLWGGGGVHKLLIDY